ncbi:MAG: histidine kinase dimerization/phospho-acceptor domain-containing protein, partial [Cyanobacteria bacterium P01_H01_bin.15]
MIWITLIVGFFGGLSYGLWLRSRSIDELRQTLNRLFPELKTSSEVSLAAYIRREIATFAHQRQTVGAELETWQHLFESAPIGFLLVDEEDQLVSCNPEARKILQIERWQPGKIRLLLELVRSYELDQLIEQARKSQTIRSSQWQFHSPRLSQNELFDKIYLQGRAVPLRQGQVAVFIENSVSSVEFTQTREQAFSDLAHELRTPLTSIALVAETLIPRVQGQTQGWVVQMYQEIQRLINLVQDWLELSHLEENPHKYLRQEETDLTSIIFSSWQTLEPLAKKKELHLSYDGPRNILTYADPTRLNQVFINIFSNSIRYSPPKKRIKILCKVLETTNDKSKIQDNLGICIDLIDAGEGFSSADLPHVFNRLYRGEPSRYRNQTNLSPGFDASED